jgi:choice-of-anchor C domain-containing protein
MSGMKTLLTGLCAIVISGAANAAPFQNGDFETGPAVASPPGLVELASGNTSITGWTVLNSGLGYVGDYWVAQSGVRSIHLNGSSGASAIQQTFDTIAGVTYTVAFFLAGHPAFEDDKGHAVSDKDKSLRYRVEGTSGLITQGFIDFPQLNQTLADMGWIPVAFTFIADGASATLEFKSQMGGAYGPAIDNVSVSSGEVTVVPLPMALPLFAAGLGALGIIRRRRDRTNGNV